MIYNDEFNIDGPPDRSKWTVDPKPKASINRGAAGVYRYHARQCARAQRRLGMITGKEGFPERRHHRSMVVRPRDIAEQNGFPVRQGGSEGQAAQSERLPARHLDDAYQQRIRRMAEKRRDRYPGTYREPARQGNVHRAYRKQQLAEQRPPFRLPHVPRCAYQLPYVFAGMVAGLAGVHVRQPRIFTPTGTRIPTGKTGLSTRNSTSFSTSPSAAVWAVLIVQADWPDSMNVDYVRVYAERPGHALS